MVRAKGELLGWLYRCLWGLLFKGVNDFFGGTGVSDLVEGDSSFKLWVAKQKELLVF